MAFELSPLPYPKNALSPHISPETVETHYEKHHRGYVDKLNELVRGTRYETLSLEEVVRQSSDELFNQAAQAWNHTFYWKCMNPRGEREPRGDLRQAIEKSFGSWQAFGHQFAESATHLFGSGYVWLVARADARLALEASSNAANPLKSPNTPLLAIDVWEHAYYLDHKNERAKYVEAFAKLVDWEFAAQNLHGARSVKSARA